MPSTDQQRWWRRAPTSPGDWVLTALLVFLVCLVTGPLFRSWAFGALVGLGMATGTLVQGGVAMVRGERQRNRPATWQPPPPPPGKRD